MTVRLKIQFSSQRVNVKNHKKIKANAKDEIANEINIVLGELPDRTTATEMYEKLGKKLNIFTR